MLQLDAIIQSALNKLDPTSTLDEIEKAVGIAKSGAEAHKTEMDVRNANALTRQESLKAWSLILVPIVSLLALVGTVIVQALQLESSRQQQAQQLAAAQQQNEDTQWRSFLDSVREETKDTPNRVISDVTFAPRLKTFVQSKVYGQQAIDVAKRTVGAIVDEAGFSDLLVVAYGNLNSVPLPDLVDISKSIYRLSLSNWNQCAIFSEGIQLPPAAGGNLCNGNITDEEVGSATAKSADKQAGALKLRQTTATIASEETLISSLLANAVRNRSKTQDVSLNGAVISLADLSNASFDGLDLANSIFDRVDLYESKLTPAKFGSIAAQGSNWWDAREINQELLEYLLANDFPGVVAGEMIVAHGKFDRDYYSQRISELCKPKLAACADSELKFNSANFAIKR